MRQQKSFENETEAILYLVPTPIGNLQDMTFRAVSILQSVELIAAEDTRNTKKLCHYFDISTPLISYHEHNLQKAGEEILARLANGIQVAIVSDAGMPAISDPGFDIATKAMASGFKVVSRPGPNAALTALIASGIMPQPFYFYGFLNRNKKKRVAELEALEMITATLIFYEAPHRLKEMVSAMNTVFGDRRITLARELTKKFEEYISGSFSEVMLWLQSSEVRGEFVVIVEGNQMPAVVEEAWWQMLSIEAHVDHYISEQGFKPTDAIKMVSKERQIQKRVVYQAYHLGDSTV